MGSTVTSFGLRRVAFTVAATVALVLQGSVARADTATDAGSAVGFGILFMFLIWGGLYILPSFVAYTRQHSSLTAIVALNILAGWTFVGWIVALVWALSADRKVLDVRVLGGRLDVSGVQRAPAVAFDGAVAPPRPIPPVEPRALAAPHAEGSPPAGKRACPACLSHIPIAASVCRYCQRDVPPASAPE